MNAPVAQTVPASRGFSTRTIFSTWWPLAISWMLMSVETPALSAVVARLADPKIHLAAYGGIVYPVSLIIESPIIMFLAASTALSKDWASFARGRRYMMVTGFVLTALHALVAFTPLFYRIAEDLLGAPAAVIEPARIGMMIMTPWTWSIAYRRFHQGVLIRSGRSRTVSTGTLIRLGADGLVLAVGYLLRLPGIIVCTSAVAVGVICEAIYIGLVVRPVLQNELRQAPPIANPLTLRSFLNFYIPLAITSLLTLLFQPLSSAAMGRMPLALESLAVWPVATGLVLMVRSLGVAYNEVVVALLDRPAAAARLRRFTIWLVASTLAIMFLFAATPLADLWFRSVSALTPELAAMARRGLWIALPVPALAALQSWFQGVILHDRSTRLITEAVAVYLGISIFTLTLAVQQAGFTGLYIAGASFVLSMAAQTAWLWLRSRPAMRALQQT